MECDIVLDNHGMQAILWSMAEASAGKIAQLKERLAKSSEATERLRLLGALSDELFSTVPREAEEYLLQQVVEARAAGKWECAGMALSDLAYSKFMGGQVGEALELAKQALALGRERNVGKVQASATNVLGLTFWQKGEFDEAIRYLEECRRLSRESDYPGGEMTALGNLGLLRLSRGRIEEALDYFQQTLPRQETLAQANPEIRGEIATTYSNIGQCHEELGDWERAIEYAYRGIALAEELDKKVTIAEGRASLASLFWKRGRNAEALRLFMSAQTVAAEVEWQDGIAEILGKVAEILLATGDLLSARNALDRSRKIARELEDRKEIALVHRRFAELWLTYPDLRTAREEIEQALKLNQELGHQIEQGTCLRVKAEILSAAGEPEAARQCYEQAIAALSLRTPMPAAAGKERGVSPPGYNYQLAIAQLAFAQFLSRTGESARAMESARQASELFRRLGVLQLAESANRLLLSLRARTGKPEDAWLAILQNLSALAGSASPLSELALSCLRLLTEGFGFRRGAFVLYGRQHYLVGTVPLQQLLALPRSRDLNVTSEEVRIPFFLRGRNIGLVFLGEGTSEIAAPPLAFWQTVQDLLTLTAERLRRRLQTVAGPSDAATATVPVPEADTSAPSTRFGGIIAVSSSLNQLLDVVERVAPTRASVLVGGESGTGKEMIARALHDLSPRQDRPFVIINCAALPETLLEAELFGIEKGVATGVQARSGKLEQADGGTVFLDEIGDMSLLLQTKLLRVLQERSFERVGGSRTITVDVRFVAATNRDLETAVKSGTFREDLYHRLNVIALSLPPLRDRKDDIPLLIEHFARSYSEEFMRPVHALSSTAMDCLLQHSWPGNIRELRNVVERAVILAREGVITPEDLPPALHPPPAASRKTHPTKLKDAKREARQQAAGSLERESLLKALEEHGWQIPEVQTALGISRSHLYRLMSRHGITKPKPKARAQAPGPSHSGPGFDDSGYEDRI